MSGGYSNGEIPGSVCGTGESGPYNQAGVDAHVPPSCGQLEPGNY